MLPMATVIELWEGPRIVLLAVVFNGLACDSSRDTFDTAIGPSDFPVGFSRRAS